MEILTVNADRKLVSIASSVGRNPQSWDGWFCLNIGLQDVDDDLFQECLLWTKSIVDSYLKEIDGRVYFCGNKTIHILCKTVSPKILQQTGQQICDLIYAENNLSVYYTIYDLIEDGFIYAQSVLEQAGTLFSLPVSVYSGVETLPSSDPMPKAQNPDAIKVLLIEDDPVTRWMVRNALKYECEFVTASTMSKAFSMYASYQPDVVFLDINLPDGDGRTVLEWIMRNDPGACVVMFSSNDNLDNISSALEDGASGFIAKPFLKEQLMHYVRSQR